MSRRSFLGAMLGSLAAGTLGAEAMQTAKALGLTIPQSLLLRADEVIR